MTPNFWKNLIDGIKTIKRIAHLEVALDEIRKYYRIINDPDFKFTKTYKELIATVNAESYQLLQVLQMEEKQ